EKHDLAAERPGRVAAMRAALESVRSHGVPPSSLLADAIDVSEAEREKLAQLGYASSSGTPRPGGPDPKDVIDLLAVRSRGADDLRAGHADEAIASLRAVLARTPGDAQARAFLGQALMAKHQWAEARSELEHALRDRHSIFAAHYNLALCCRELGDQDTALSE